MMFLFLKAHIPGYTKKDGTYVPPHETKAPTAKVVAQFSHKAPLPDDAYEKVGKPAEIPPAPKAKVKMSDVVAQHAADLKSKFIGKPKGLFSQMIEKEAAATAKKFGKPAGVIGAQFGGKTPSDAMPKEKWQNKLHSGGPIKLKVMSVTENESSSQSHADIHPEEDDDGNQVQILKPSKPSPPSTWTDPAEVATFVPDSDVPPELNGVSFEPWLDAPDSIDGWNDVAGQLPDLDEPEVPEAFLANGKAKDLAAGVIIEEPDGRIWLIRPTNGFGGYDATFPKGRVEDGMNLQASAIKEAFEETGMQVEITGFHGDFERTQTIARYYTARRVGGTPASMGWESQAVQLVPREQLNKILNRQVDRSIAKNAKVEKLRRKKKKD